MTPVEKSKKFMLSVYRTRSSNRIRKDIKYLYGKTELNSNLSYLVAMDVLRERGELNWIK